MGNQISGLVKSFYLSTGICYDTEIDNDVFKEKILFYLDISNAFEEKRISGVSSLKINGKLVSHKLART